MCKEIKEMFEDLRVKYASLKDSNPDEKNTESWFINPFLESLGYPVSNHLLVEQQFVADRGRVNMQRGNPGAGKVDFAIKHKETKDPIIFIECKRLDADLDGGRFSAFEQINRYYTLNPTVDFALLSNGNEYRLYLGQDTPRRLVKEPFICFNIERFTDDDIKVLKLLSCENYKPEEVRKIARYRIDEEKVLSYLKSNISNAPSEEFVKFLSKVVFGDKTVRNLRKVKSIVTNLLLELGPKAPQPNPPCCDKPEPTPNSPKNIFDIRVLTHIKPEYIIFENQKEVITNWRDVLEFLMKKLLDRDVAGIFELNSNSISTQRKWRDSRHIGHGYYIEANKSAKDILSILKKSLSHLNLRDDLYLSIRHTRTLKQ